MDDKQASCPVCRARSLGAAMMRDCHLGKKTPFQVAKELNCTYDEVMAHENEQHELHLDDEGHLDSEDVLLKKLSDNLNTLAEWTALVINSVQKPSDIDRAKVTMLTSLTQEIRKTVAEVAELQGRKGPGDTYIQMQTLNQRVVSLTNGVIDVCCDDCKRKILGVIEAQSGDTCATPALKSRM